MQRRMSSIKEYKFFRSFSAKIENWPVRKAEAIWRKMRERKIAGN
jgi:deleted in liver cancer protein